MNNHIHTSGYMRIICGTCGEPMNYTIGYINGMGVCLYCYDLHRISKNTMELPIKNLRSRKLPEKPQPIKCELSTGVIGLTNPNANTFTVPTLHSQWLGKP